MDGDPSKNPPGTRPGFFRFIWLSARRLVLAVIGFTVVLVGIALLVLPGPGIAIIIAGFAILAVEFAWARKILQQGNRATRSALYKLGLKKKSQPEGTAENPVGPHDMDETGTSLR
jgi:hypothetical protein